MKLYGVTVDGSSESEFNDIAFKTREAAHKWCVDYWEKNGCEEEFWPENWRETLEDLAWIHEIDVLDALE